MFSILFSSIYLISSSPILTPHSQPTKTIVNCHSVSLVKASEIDLYHDIATCQSNKLFFSSFLYRIMYVVFPFFSFFFFFKHFSGSPSYHNNKREKNFVYYRSGVVWEVKGGRNVWFEWRRAAPSFLLLPRVFFLFFLGRRSTSTPLAFSLRLRHVQSIIVIKKTYVSWSSPRFFFFAPESQRNQRCRERDSAESDGSLSATLMWLEKYCVFFFFFFFFHFKGRRLSGRKKKKRKIERRQWMWRSQRRTAGNSPSTMKRIKYSSTTHTKKEACKLVTFFIIDLLPFLLLVRYPPFIFILQFLCC